MPADQLITPAGCDATQDWWQACVQLTPPDTADVTASERAAVAHLAPLLDQAREGGLIGGWWFIRKHPCWRLRLQLPNGHADPAIPAALDGLTGSGSIYRWWPGIYEAEAAAFGGTEAVTAAHALFIADTQGIMALLGGAPFGLGRRELSIILCTALLHGAGLEWYEQGDAWHRVTRERPLPADVQHDRIAELASTIRSLLGADTSADSPLLQPGGPMANGARWAGSFRQTGKILRDLARSGTLQRGLREVLSYHVIFHWNRLGLTARQQAILARAAREAILGPAPAAGPRARAVARSGLGVDLDGIARRFPLVPRPRLACPDLATRVRQACEVAASFFRAGDSDERIDLACTVMNQAALTAADCGPPDLAAELCDRQHAIFRSAGPVTGRVAIASLQPLVNLARLDLRAGQPDRAYQALIQLAEAARHGGGVEVHGRSLTLDRLGADDDIINTWLRDVLLHDGTRALAAMGAWAEAAEHAAQHDDHPGRLHVARQARIISSVVNGGRNTALALIDEAVLTQPWEHAVAACLRAYAHLTAGEAIPDGSISALALARFAIQPASPGMAVFHIRLSLTAAELATAIDPAQGCLLIQAADDAIEGGDAHAAREVLANPTATRLLPAAQRQRLFDLKVASGLEAGSIPEPLRQDLLAAISAAEDQLRLSLRSWSDAGRGRSPGNQ